MRLERIKMGSDAVAYIPAIMLSPKEPRSRASRSSALQRRMFASAVHMPWRVR